MVIMEGDKFNWQTKSWLTAHPLYHGRVTYLKGYIIEEVRALPAWSRWGLLRLATHTHVRAYHFPPPGRSGALHGAPSVRTVHPDAPVPQERRCVRASPLFAPAYRCVARAAPNVLRALAVRRFLPTLPLFVLASCVENRPHFVAAGVRQAHICCVDRVSEHGCPRRRDARPVRPAASRAAEVRAAGSQHDRAGRVNVGAQPDQ